MIEYDEDGNDTRITGKPARVGGGKYYGRGGLVDVSGALSVGHAAPSVPPVAAAMFHDVLWSQWSYDASVDMFSFKTTNPVTAKFEIAAERLDEVRHLIPSGLWGAMQRIRAVPASDMQWLRVGDSFRNFGRITHINAEAGEVWFGTVNLSVEMLEVISNLMIRTGVRTPRKLAQDAGLPWLPQPTPAPPTPDEAMELILKAIRNAPDSFATGGEWLSKLTTAITEITREEDDG